MIIEFDWFCSLLFIQSMRTKFRIIIEDLNLKQMNLILTDEILKPMRAGIWIRAPPVLETISEYALKSNQWVDKAFVILLTAHTDETFANSIFEGELDATKQLMLVRFQLFFDSFLKGLHIKDNKLVPYEATSSRCSRSYGWILWELRSYALQL